MAAFATSDIKRSFKAIAAKLNVDEVTVRKRLAKMERNGFLRYWMVMVNPTLLGLRGAQLSLDVPSPTDKHDLIEQLKLLPGSMVVVDCYGSSLFFGFFYRGGDSLQRQVDLVRRMSKTTNLVCTTIPTPECGIKLTETDWEIVRSLQNTPRKPYGTIARELRVSTRTVKRRLQRLISNRAIFILPSMNPSALEGVNQADLLVLYESPRSKAEVDWRIMALWDDYIARAELGARDSSFFNLFIKNVSKAQEVLDWVRQQPGVKSSRVDLVQNRYELYDALSKEFDIAIQRFPAPPIRTAHRRGRFAPRLQTSLGLPI